MSKNYLLIFILIAFSSINLLQAQSIQQNIKCQLDPENNKINAEVEVVFPAEIPAGKVIEFMLNKNLRIISSDVKVEEIQMNDSSIIYKKYKILPSNTNGLKSISIQYEGKINEDPDAGAAEYARGFSQTSGIISSKGVYLGGGTYWNPTFNDKMYTFSLNVKVPKEWKVVSQGIYESQEAQIIYNCDKPQEEIYLIGAKFTVYEKNLDNVKIQAFLRTPDTKLANKYMEATADYLKMYEEMIGEYPYSKFALVENFWETGYGMPSFTLLGEKVIRFPFIIYSSYPHELLHNYWGNSVYIDYGSGNWCEGITAYMADHLLKEQAGQGAEYRRSTLQKFTDYVDKTNDFPLNQFMSRNNSAEEAIGYGKCLMMNHMLRLKVGDDQFLDNYRNFYNNNIYKKASFNDIAQEFMKNANWDINSFFDQWVNGTGAPNLVLSDVARNKDGEKWNLDFHIAQSQEGEQFNLDIPVAIYFADEVIKISFSMLQKEQGFSYSCDKKPLKIEIDPEYDIFRKLDKRESPSSISQIMGSTDLLIILPSTDPNLEAYKAMANTWEVAGKAQGKNIVISYDSKLTNLPTDKSVWVLGNKNKMKTFLSKVTDIKSQLSDTEFSSLTNAATRGSIVMTSIPSSSPSVTYGFVGCSNADAIAGLTRLLPHYGKYSVLAFEGSKPSNTAKIILNPDHSPLHFQFNDAEKELSSTVKLIPAKPLVQ